MELVQVHDIIQKIEFSYSFNSKVIAGTGISLQLISYLSELYQYKLIIRKVLQLWPNNISKSLSLIREVYLRAKLIFVCGWLVQLNAEYNTNCNVMASIFLIIASTPRLSQLSGLSWWTNITLTQLYYFYSSLCS